MKKRIPLSLACFCLVGVRVIAQVPTPDHVVIVMEENHDYLQIIGSSAAPYINALITDSSAALFTQSYALTHPSQPNYIMLFSGSAQGVSDDELPAGLPFTSANLGASLLSAGKTFGGYSEDLPAIGYNGTTWGAYARKHNPWVNWQSSPVNGLPTTANLPLTSFPAHFDSLPFVTFVIPNQDNDMHNGSDPGTITTGDTWLQSHMDAYIRWAKVHNSLFILTFDEGTDSGPNRIVTFFIGSMVKRGQYIETINHYSLLRTIEEMFSLPHSGGSASAAPITDCWKVRAKAAVLLEGPYNTGTLQMEKTLNTNGILANHFIGRAVPTDAVDSISIEVRNSAIAPTTRQYCAAWLMNDGSIRNFADTTKDYVECDVNAGSYFLVIHHRNHVAIMSAFSVVLNAATSTVFDFTQSQNAAYGSNPMKQVGAKFAMYAGDTNNSAFVSAADANNVFGSLGVTGYDPNDVNLSGIVTAADANTIFANLNAASQVP